jgi:hypothetical protein
MMQTLSVANSHNQVLGQARTTSDSVYSTVKTAGTEALAQ